MLELLYKLKFAKLSKSQIICSAVILIALLAFYFLYANTSAKVAKYQNNLLKTEKELQVLRQELDKLRLEMSKKDELIDTHKKLIQVLQQDKRGLEKQYNAFIVASQEAAKSVELFKKKAEADKKLLAKYSKIYFLNEHYAPARLKMIDKEFSYKDKVLQIKEEVYPFLIAMLRDMKKDELDPKVLSAYRSFDEQKFIKGRYLQIYGEGANKFSADQGYSEHQLGTTIDITRNSDPLKISFEDTDEFKWLQDNAWKYGFILSYPKDNKYYIYEPWHWRFVGKKLAKYLHDNNLHFYDLSQNNIYGYLLDIFDNVPELE